MMEFENNTEYELPEEERCVLMMTLNECLENASDTQLEAIYNYALRIAPIPRAESADNERIDKLFHSVANVLMSISDKKTPGIVAISAYEALGICHDKELEARLGLSDYLNSCTSTALQTGDLSNLEHLEKVITTIHDLVGDYEPPASYTCTSNSSWDDEDDEDLDSLF